VPISTSGSGPRLRELKSQVIRSNTYRSVLYIYGWGRAQTCSALMANPADLNWYDQHAIPGKAPIHKLTPTLDSDS
jgi:hypothetical protein